MIEKRGGASWAPPLLKKQERVAVYKISDPDHQDSAIASCRVVDETVEKG